MNPLIAAMIRASGRSWWQCRYSDGKVLSEWDTFTGKSLSSGTSRWEEVPKKGMVGLRLLCPNGMAGELEAPEGHRFFQLKLGHYNVTLTFGGNTKTESSRSVDSHIIGVVRDAEGNCLCRAWEYPIWEDEMWRRCWRCHDLVNTEFCHCGQDLRGIARVDRARLKIKKVRKLLRPAQLIRFEDNINDMKYHNIGKLSLEVQGIKF